jgi:hypothetical protein
MQAQAIYNSDECVEIKEHENFLSVETYTVVYPWTMMINVCYASLTTVTVTGMRWFDRIALIAGFL